VAEEAAQGTFTMAADVRQWVAQQFGVTYRPKGIYGLLRRVGCRPKVPRPIHVKADLEAQEDWKKATVFNVKDAEHQEPRFVDV
jgi:transposase